MSYSTQDLFVAGQGSYHTYRIPALEVTAQGTLLAFCEGRKHSRSDYGEIDLLVRRSTDGGTTWGPVQVIVTQPDTTCGNPAPVLDRETGVIWLPFCKNPASANKDTITTGESYRTVWLTRSEDDGVTWSEPVDITPSVKAPGWTWYATGPCHGIQLTQGTHAGRLLIPCDHRARTPEGGELRRSHVIYSDDHGATWQIGGVVEEEGTNESTAVETADGAVYLSCRDQAKRGRRCVAWSHDGGATFPEYAFDQALIEPACQASLLRVGAPGQPVGGPILFANPASATRDTLAIRLSYDSCRTWTAGAVLHPGRAAYSDLAVTPDLTIHCLYECGEDSPYDRLTLASFDVAWLESNQRKTA